MAGSERPRLPKQWWNFMGAQEPPPGYIGCRNRFLDIDSWAPYKFKNTLSVCGGRRIYKYSIPFLGGDDIFAGRKEKEPEKDIKGGH